MAQVPDETKFSRPNGDFDSDGFNQVYDAWQADRRKQTDQPEGYTDVLDGYLRAVIPQLLTGGSGENKVCSPHQSLHGPRHAGGGDGRRSREQILSPCWAAAMWERPSAPKAAAVWNANYCDDGAVTSILANSLWLTTKSASSRKPWTRWQSIITPRPSVVREMAPPPLTRRFRTGSTSRPAGFEEQASGLTMDQETILALASTIYFRAKWDGEFSRPTPRRIPSTPTAAIQPVTSCVSAGRTPITGATASPRFQAVGGQRRHVVPAAGRGRCAGGAAG